MRTKKKWAVILALISIVLITLMLRYPSTPHQRLPDSKDYHYMTSLVKSYGYPFWSYHPLLTPLGFHPISFGPLGMVFVLSNFSITSGVQVESSILVTNLVSSLVLALSGFLLGREIFKKNIIGLLTSFFFVSSTKLIGLTSWTGTPRGLAACFLPFLLLLMIKGYRFTVRSQVRKKMLLLFFLTLFAILGSHKLTYLFLPPLIAYPIYLKIYSTYKKSSQGIVSKLKYKIDRRIIYVIKPILFSGLLVSMIIFSILFATSFFSRSYFLTSSAIISGNHILIKSFNLLYLAARNMGVASIFSFVGFFALSIKRKKSSQLFLFIGLLSFIPFSIRYAYIYPIWIVFLALFAGYGFYRIAESLNREKVAKAVPIIVLSILLSSIMVVPSLVTIEEPYKGEGQKKNYVEDIEVESSIYLKYDISSDESFHSQENNNLFSSFAQRSNPDLNGIGIIWANRSLEENLTFEPVYESYNDFSLEKFHKSKGSLYIIKNDPLFTSKNHWSRRHIRYIRTRFKTKRYDRIVQAYNLKVFIINERYGREYDYVKTLENEEYSYYKNSRFSFYPVP